MKTRFRVLIGAGAGLMLALSALSPAGAAPAGTYTAVADGTALSLSISSGGSSVLSVDAGITHAELDSTPHAASSGAGLVQLPDTVAETDAPPDDSRVAELFSQAIGDPATGTGLGLEVLRGTSTSEVSGDATATAVGEVLGAALNVANLVGTNDFAVRSTSETIVNGSTVTATGHSDEVVITLSLGDDVVSPVCDLLDSLPLGIGETCHTAVDAVSPLTTVATIRILPATVVCQYNGANETASVPTAEAALASIQLFEDSPIPVNIGQTVDLLGDTPLAIHADIGVATTDVKGNSASARAAGLELSLFADPLPNVNLTASEVTCGVAGELPPPIPQTPTRGVTGGSLPPVVFGAAALMLVGLVARRFAKVS